MNKNIQDIIKYLRKRNLEFREHCDVPISRSSGVEISRIWADVFIPSKQIVILERPDNRLESLGYRVIVVDEKQGNYIEEIERMLC
jgi:hypothetical protein